MSPLFVLAAAGDFVGFGIGAGLIALIIGIAAVVAWVVGLIGALTNPGLTAGEKIVWVLVIFFLPVIGTIAYFILRPTTTAGPRATL